jgi:murein L,D-transpeptidase YafK
MRLRVLAGLMLGALYGLSVAQAPATSLSADRVVVLKKERTLQLFKQGEMIKTYNVSLGADPVGPKTRQGDHKTPEGNYVLDSRNSYSQFHKSINISYPNATARPRG